MIGRKNRFAVLVLTGVAGLCLTVPPMLAQTSKKDTKMANQFRDEGAKARLAIEKARDQLQVTMATYDALLGTEDVKKRPGAQKKLTTELGKMAKTVEDGKKQVTAFQSLAGDFFPAWEEQLAGIQTAELKAASEKRLGVAKELFENMATNLTAASEAYGPMMASLNEQATLIGQDNSDDTLEILNEVAPGIHTQADQVFENIENALSQETSHENEMGAVMEEETAEVDEAAEADAAVEEEAVAEEETLAEDAAGDDPPADDDSDNR